MNIYLGEHFEQFIRDQVATGRYANASEVVREALRRYEHRTRYNAYVRARVHEGLKDVQVGRVTRVENLAEFLESIRKRAKERRGEPGTQAEGSAK